MKQLSIVAAALIFLFACKKDSNVPKDADFVFTQYACFCAGNCVSGYKIAENKLYKGAGERCEIENLNYDSQALDAAKLALAEALRDAIPQMMLDAKQERYGCPDCADQGGYYVKLQTNDGARNWYLDTRKDALPDEVRGFVEKLEQTFDALQ